jgi:putative endonuclease
MATHIDTGKKGESLAVEYLLKEGYQIYECNYRFKKLEIDIIAFKQPLLVFVEVKTKTNISFGYPEDDVTPKKAANILEAAEHYMEQSQWRGQVRYDIVAITLLANSTPEITHIKDAFY